MNAIATDILKADYQGMTPKLALWIVPLIRSEKHISYPRLTWPGALRMTFVSPSGIRDGAFDNFIRRERYSDMTLRDLMRILKLGHPLRRDLVHAAYILCEAPENERTTEVTIWARHIFWE